MAASRRRVGIADGRDSRRRDNDDDDDRFTTRRVAKTIRNESAKWRLIARLFREFSSDSEKDSSERDDDDVKTDFSENSEKTIDETKRIVRNVTDERRFVRLARRMYELKYSSNYIFSVWSTLRSHNALATRSLFADFARDWLRSTDVSENVDTTIAALSEDFRKTTFSEVNETTTSPRRRYRASRKSDGRLTFSDSEYRLLLDGTIAALDEELSAWGFFESTEKSLDHVLRARYGDSMEKNVALERYRNWCQFLYVFYTLAVTGKRLSDIASIESSQLRHLRTRGVCVVRIRKTGGLGRIEIPEIMAVCSEKSLEKGQAVIRRFRGFELLRERSVLDIPFDVSRKRRSLDRSLNRVYSETFGRAKSRGLSFHALRRIYAGYRFLSGASIERIRENLDHSHRRQTNRYVNNCLFEML